MGLYDVLEIKDKTIDQKGVKKAFKKLAKKYHPDRNPGDKISEQHFKLIQEAYATLGSKWRRNLYDNDLRWGKTSKAGVEKHDWTEHWEEEREQRRARYRRYVIGERIDIPYNNMAPRPTHSVMIFAFLFLWTTVLVYLPDIEGASSKETGDDEEEDTLWIRTAWAFNNPITQEWERIEYAKTDQGIEDGPLSPSDFQCTDINGNPIPKPPIGIPTKERRKRFRVPTPAELYMLYKEELERVADIEPTDEETQTEDSKGGRHTAAGITQDFEKFGLTGLVKQALDDGSGTNTARQTFAKNWPRKELTVLRLPQTQMNWTPTIYWD